MNKAQRKEKYERIFDVCINNENLAEQAKILGMTPSAVLKALSFIAKQQNESFDSSLKGIRGKPLFREKVSSGVHGIGKLGQDKFEEALRSRNIVFEPVYLNSTCDYIVNGLRIEVKANSKKNRDGHYQCLLRKNKGCFDVLAFFIVPLDIWLIIPSNLADGEAFYVNENSKSSKYVHKWDAYINNFDLLKV